MSALNPSETASQTFWTGLLVAGVLTMLLAVAALFVVFSFGVAGGSY